MTPRKWDLVSHIVVTCGQGQDAHKISEIAQLVLKVLRGNLAVSVIAFAIGQVIEQFKDAYQCQGPVMLSSLPYSKATLMNMQYGQAVCTTRNYDYQTSGGCKKDQPFDLTSKVSKYVAEDCIQRFQGSSNKAGEVNIDHGNSAGQDVRPARQWLGLVLGAVLVLM